MLSQHIDKNGQQFFITCRPAEDARIVRKLDFLFLPIFSLMFTWMAIDRTNVSGVLTSTFLNDTSMTHDQANTGVSLLWFGIVLLEIPSNIVLHRVGPHYWIPGQVIVWVLVEVLQCRVTDASGWYAARLFLGLAESGFIPNGLYTLSRWYAPDELTKRTAAFFPGPICLRGFWVVDLGGCFDFAWQGGLRGWQWIFIICGVSTIAVGLLAFALVPKSPYHTGELFGGLFHLGGWLSEHEADILVARQARRADHQAAGSTLNISWKDITSVLLHWSTWPSLITCSSSLQCVGGLSTWHTTIIKSLGFIDRYNRFGYAILFVGVWTLAGLIALYRLPVHSESSWSFYVAYLVAQAAPSWQPINVTWLSHNFEMHQKRAVAYATYSGTYGNQVFRASDARLYKTAWTVCISLGAVWLAVTMLQILEFRWVNRLSAKTLNPESQAELEGRTNT
ncbi:major facilitator superfamily domain-containing protein [Aspergillus foveolatus]|uniref:major facilitator superfamily domain-containing protein n=1 Tax=Aspergillus foveolatus TaxID=210207 RepID=UPI003CCDA9E2